MNKTHKLKKRDKIQVRYRRYYRYCRYCKLKILISYWFKKHNSAALNGLCPWQR